MCKFCAYSYLFHDDNKREEGDGKNKDFTIVLGGQISSMREKGNDSQKYFVIIILVGQISWREPKRNSFSCILWSGIDKMHMSIKFTYEFCLRRYMYVCLCVDRETP